MRLATFRLLCCESCKRKYDFEHRNNSVRLLICFDDAHSKDLKYCINFRSRHEMTALILAEEILP